jgi:hypothetical protein
MKQGAKIIAAAGAIVGGAGALAAMMATAAPGGMNRNGFERLFG